MPDLKEFEFKFETYNGCNRSRNTFVMKTENYCLDAGITGVYFPRLENCPTTKTVLFETHEYALNFKKQLLYSLKQCGLKICKNSNLK